MNYLLQLAFFHLPIYCIFRLILFFDPIPIPNEQDVTHVSLHRLYLDTKTNYKYI